jgi:radical SAM protein with 4Fe4S-binding SPASM domain
MCTVAYHPVPGRAERYLPGEEIRRLIGDTPSTAAVTLQGVGEPLLSPELLDLVEFCKERGLEVGFTTNGTLVTQEIAERLVAAGTDFLNVSLDSVDPDTYRAMRGRARLEQAVRGLRHLTRARASAGAALPRIHVDVVLTRASVHGLADVVTVAAECGADGVIAQNLGHTFSDRADDERYRRIREWTVGQSLTDARSDPQVQAAFDAARVAADAAGISLRLPWQPRTPRPAGSPPCSWPWEAAYVSRDGTVLPCSLLAGQHRYSLGSLADSSLAEIWDDARYREFRARLLGDDPPEVCRGCAEYRGDF